MKILLDILRKVRIMRKLAFDLQEMGIIKKLHPTKFEAEDHQKTLLAKACYSLTNEEKDIFCQVLKGVKLSDSCASNTP